MQIMIKNTNLLYFLYLILYLYPCIAQPSTTSFCGKIRIQAPFSLQNTIESTPLSKILICKSQKVYFRTTLGLLQVSSIDYKAKTLTISHTSCSSSVHFISPSLLSAGFPSPSKLNSLLLFNCLSQRKPLSPVLHNCTTFYGCKTLSKKQDDQPSSCWIVHDLENLEVGFDPKDLKCSHYKRVYRDSASTASNFSEGFKLGTVISFDIPDHVPNVCDECTKPQGNCGVGLRCICHPKECRDKVISKGAPMRPYVGVFLYFLVSTILVISFTGYL
ncbi:hypothetical protein AQUCO_02700389v1 [Aquilegia coerulea]|uniref:Wall-associated receptor kinase C-terminal domain-containing protein n=1 Tax=Aquilegia coerulea TaxID=218851 RepID=A0A2G5D6P1_AQUCA|nr:hypothetical protein AQUCO_02700389v1 [Aquilegia coerulea]